MKILNTKYLKSSTYPNDIDPNSMWAEVAILMDSEMGVRETHLIKSTWNAQDFTEISINEIFNVTRNSSVPPDSSVGVLFKTHIKNKYLNKIE